MAASERKSRAPTLTARFATAKTGTSPGIGSPFPNPSPEEHTAMQPKSANFSIVHCTIARRSGLQGKFALRLDVLEHVDLDPARQHRTPGLQIGLQPRVARDPLTIGL